MVEAVEVRITAKEKEEDEEEMEEGSDKGLDASTSCKQKGQSALQHSNDETQELPHRLMSLMNPKPHLTRSTTSLLLAVLQKH